MINSDLKKAVCRVLPRVTTPMIVATEPLFGLAAFFTISCMLLAVVGPSTPLICSKILPVVSSRISGYQSPSLPET